MYKDTIAVRKSVKEAAEHEDSLLTTKQEYYTAVAHALIDAGCPRDQVSKTGRKLIETRLRTKHKDSNIRINTRHWYATMSQIGCTDPLYAHKKSDDGEVDAPDDNSTDEREPDPGNLELLKMLGNYKQSITMLQHTIQSITIPVCPDNDTRKKLLKDMQYAADEARGAVSGRPKIANNTHHIWKLCAATEFGLRKISASYLQHRITQLEHEALMDMKQVRKYAKNQEPNQMECYKPRNQDDALYRGFLGVKCPECGSYRVNSHPKSDAECEDCKAQFGSGILMSHNECGYILTESDPVILKDNIIDCPRCENIISVPDDLIPRLNSG